MRCNSRPFLPAFTLPITSSTPRPPPPLSRRRPRPALTPLQSSAPHYSPTRLQLARIRFHLLRAAHADAAEHGADPPQTATSTPEASTRGRGEYSEEEKRARSERLRAKWADPEWRAAMLARRRSKETVEKMKESAKKLWRDPEHRARMRAARVGRAAPNKGVAASEVTRLRMSVARKGVKFSEERKRKMSMAKLNRPDGDDWARLISESKRGKTKEYFAMRREFRALYRDLKLWSDCYRAKYGRLPSAEGYERAVAPMMVLRIRRFLTLRESIGGDGEDVGREIISK